MAAKPTLLLVSARVLLTNGTDTVQLMTGLPPPAPNSPFGRQPLDLCFEADQNQGVAYLQQHFPGLPYDVVSTRSRSQVAPDRQKAPSGSPRAPVGPPNGEAAAKVTEAERESWPNGEPLGRTKLARMAGRSNLANPTKGGPDHSRSLASQGQSRPVKAERMRLPRTFR